MIFISHARLNIPVDITSIQDELVNFSLPDTWKPHYNTYDYSGSWDVLALRSPAGNIDTPFAESNNIGAFRDTELMQQFPSIKLLLDSLKTDLLSVRLLSLKAGSVIKPHRDRELCFENGEARIHFPVFTNPQVDFFLNNEKLLMKEGECWYINANLTHNVTNNGSTDRIHLVVDCKVNDWLKEKFSAAEKSFAEVEVPDQRQQIIEQLRWQNTETSNKLADEIFAEMNKPPGA